MILQMMKMNKLRRSRGFTLLELIVAIAIFSIISTSSAYFIRNVLLAQERSNEIATQLEEVQKVWLLLQQDIEQAVARSVRDQNGDPKPVFSGEQQQLAFTRIGWPLLPPRAVLLTEKNEGPQVAGVVTSPRSEVLRVRYYLEDERLMRSYWPIPDLAEDAQPQTSVVLSKVTALELQYVFASPNDKQQTSETWPPDVLAFPSAPPLPHAVKVTLTFERYGELYRWFEILNNPPSNSNSEAN
jgi:general secretion pathway protein J